MFFIKLILTIKHLILISSLINYLFIILAVFKALFSGVPIQASQLFLKIGFLINTIEGVGQCLSCGSLFIILQLKEFLYSYFSLSDVMIGSIFYFTTGLHGFHVLFGSFGFFLTL